MMFFRAKESLEHVNCHVSSAFCSLGQSRSLSLCLIILILWKVLVNYFVECPQLRITWHFLLIQSRLCFLDRKTSDVIFCLFHFTYQSHFMSFCLIIGIKFDNLVSMESARVLHCKVTLFPFIISILWKDTFRLYKYLVASQAPPFLVLLFIGDSCLN